MSIREVAKKAKVSIATVSRTINNSSGVDPKTAERVWKAIEELRYYPDTQARALVSGRSRILGLIVSDITNPFFPELIKGFEDIAVHHGYEILISSTNYEPARMALCVRRMLERKVEGVAIMTSEMDPALIDELERRRVPTVFLDLGAPKAHMRSVTVDYASGISQAVEHLLSLGHARIGFISGPLDLKSAGIRRRAFLECMSRAGVLDEGLILEGDHKIDGGLAAMNCFLKLSVLPTAVLTSNDLTAIGAMRAVRLHGLSVPDDISVIGFDDIHLAQFTEPTLTTVRLPRRKLAERTFQSLYTVIEGETHGEEEYSIETMLVIRESTRARRSRGD